MIPKENIPILEEVDLLKWHDAGYTGKDVTIVLLDSKTGDPREHMKYWYFDVLDRYDDTGHATNVGYSAHVAAPNIRVLYFASTHSGIPEPRANSNGKIISCGITDSVLVAVVTRCADNRDS